MKENAKPRFFNANNARGVDKTLLFIFLLAAILTNFYAFKRSIQMFFTALFLGKKKRQINKILIMNKLISRNVFHVFYCIGIR